MNRRADTSRSVYDKSTDAVASVNQKILDTLNKKSSTYPKPGKVDAVSTEDPESKTTFSCQVVGGDKVRKEDDVEDLEEWLDDFLDE